MKQFIIGSMIFLFLVNCSIASASNDTITFGWIGPLTGNSAVVGVDSLNAIRMAVDQLNDHGGLLGKQVTLVIEDDQYDTQKAITAYSKMVATDKPLAIFMSTYGAVFALNDRPVKDNVIIFDVLDCNNDIASLPENTFCLATKTESVAEGFYNDIIQRKLHSALILFEENDPWMLFIENATKEMLQKSKVTVTSEGTLASANDYKAILLKAKKNGVDAIIFLGNDPMGLALRQARELDLTAQFYSVGSMTSPGFQSLSGKASDGCLVSFWETPKSKSYQSFIDSFEKEFGRKPMLELASIPSYDAVQLVINSIKSASALEVDKVKAYLLSVKNHQGLSGEITFDPDGAVRSIKEKLYIFKNGKLSDYDGFTQDKS